MKPAVELRLGTRRSALALAQGRHVARALEARDPLLRVRFIGIESRGDQLTDVPLREVEGKSFFTAEIDEALLRGDVDFAVHSLKDLALDRPAGLASAAIPQRAFAHDVLLCGPAVLQRLAGGATLRIGTSSPRRLELAAPFLREALPTIHAPPQIEFTDLRGNVDTRLARLHQPSGSARHLDGIVIALAGLQRLWADQGVESCGRDRLQPLLRGLRWMLLPLSLCPTAPGQGALAIECRASDTATLERLQALHDPATAGEIARERAILARWGGGCHQAFGATVVTHGGFGSLLIARGVSSDGTRLDQEVWSARAAPNMPARDLRPWDGARQGRPRVERLAIESDVLRDLNAHPERPVFIAHRHAVPDGPVSLATQRLWVSGIASWRALAARGFWVEGCADGFGFDALRPILAEPVLGLPPLAQWNILTHEGAEAHWPFGRAFATYRLVHAHAGEGPSPDVTHVYWSSVTQFEALKQYVAHSVHHASGPGRTAAHLAAQGIAPRDIFPSVDAWRRWVGLSS
jgi:hydroxymethylbilane synthase